MKTLGLIGGTIWVSTVEYYRIINQMVNERLGGLHSAKLLLYSLNYEEFKLPVEPDGWEKIAETLTGIAKNLESAGADCILLCANTTHIVADIVQQKISIPLIHIAEETAKEVVKRKIGTVGLLGTKFTMEKPFFIERLTKYGIKTLIPDEEERDFIHSNIFKELGVGIFKEETKKKYLEIIRKLKQQGAEGIIFGCTEIPMLIKEQESPLPVFDTLRIHANAAVDFAIRDKTKYTRPR